MNYELPQLLSESLVAEGVTDHRFLRALPHGSIGGNLRMLIAGTAGSSLLQENRPRLPNPMEGVMDDLMESRRQAYRQLMEADWFIDFFREATSIDVIEYSRICSLPSRRSGQRSLSDLRAIPWVLPGASPVSFSPVDMDSGRSYHR